MTWSCIGREAGWSHLSACSPLAAGLVMTQRGSSKLGLCVPLLLHRPLCVLPERNSLHLSTSYVALNTVFEVICSDHTLKH